MKELHFKEVVAPARYTGSVANWLEWSRRFRDFGVARTDERLDELLTCIDQLRGRLVTAEDEATWEAKLDFTPSIEAWKKRLYVFLDACTGGSAALTVTQCGASRACDAWRLSSQTREICCAEIV